MADAAADAAAHGWPPDGCCANCATRLAGDWCHVCGQRATAHHRSLRHLFYETLEDLTHADGRLWRTLRLLVLHPARLTRDYLTGHRASEIPPLRLFFVIVLLVFAFGARIGGLHVSLTPGAGEQSNLSHAVAKFAISGWPRLSEWTRVHVQHAVLDPGAFAANMGEWAERFAVLLLPLTALGLRLLFPLRRDLGFYDHLVFTMHSLSFAGATWVAVLLLWRGLSMPGGVVALLLLLVPVHLFVHMRGVYGSRTIPTLLRMVALAWFTLASFVLLLAMLALVSLGTLED